MQRSLLPWRTPRRLLASLALLMCAGVAQAGLFDDEEARRAILDLRTRITTNDESTKTRLAELAQTNAQLLEQVQQMRRSLLDMNTQLEAQRADNAKLRGLQEQVVRDQAQLAKDQALLTTSNAQLTKDVAELQRRLKDTAQGVEDRLRKMEPVTVQFDGLEFKADPDEKRAFEASLATLRTGDFDKGAAALQGFVRRYPSSGYLDSARYWLGNALYGQKNYRDAINVFRAMLGNAPEHPRAAEALLGVANCQVEMKDLKAARKTLDDLLKAYPNSEAAVAGKERLGALKG